MPIRTQGQTHPSVYRSWPGGDGYNDDYTQNSEDTALVRPYFAALFWPFNKF